MKSPWKKYNSRIVYKNKWISVHEDLVKRPDGRKGIYGYVKIGKTVGVVALTKNNEIFLIQEYRYPLRKYTLEIPRGMIKKGESIRAAAKRELREEAGVAATQWQSLGYVNTTPGIVDEFAYIFLARSITIGKPQPESVERQKVFCVPWRQAYQWALSGKINDSLTISALQRLGKLLS